MSDEEKENEDNESKILLDHSCHMHPLSLSVVGLRSGMCYGCSRYISFRETAYTCSRKDCWSLIILHKDCAEMPREITLSSHPQHSLILKDVAGYIKLICAVCARWINRIGYYCSSSGSSCMFQVHLGCAHDIITLKSNINIEHPSHPRHHLTLLQKSCSFKCDACGTRHEGSSYICNDCQYWIHESCANLPPTMDFYHHHHVLSLAYRVPLDYIRFDSNYCRICLKILFAGYWMYHCETCRYVVHINCAIHNNFGMV